MNVVRVLLAVAAAVDLTAAILILIPARSLFDQLGIPLGAPLLHFRFAGLLLIILPVFYLMGALRPRLAMPIAAGAVVARALGVGFLCAHLMAGEAASAYWTAMVVEAAIGGLHWLSLRHAGVSLTGAFAS